MKSEFKVDPERICRAKGHIWQRKDKPHAKSSYWDDPRHSAEDFPLTCERCGKAAQPIDVAQHK